jgi:hypothetical protein
VKSTLGLLALFAASVAGCAASAPTSDRLGLPLRRPVTAQELRAHAESALLYPQSRLLRRIGADEHRQAGEHEPDPAYAGAVATTTASATTLLGWYDRQLTGRGYIRAAYYRPANQVAGGAWTIRHSREQIQVGVYSPGAAAGTMPAGTIAYEELLVNYRVTGPPPG